VMTHPVGAVLDAAAPALDARGAAAELAARIQIPRRLPVRYDGQPMRHLSNSSYTKFLLCPEDWRRHYLKGERTPPSGAMFLGSRVDDAVTGFYARQLEHGEILDVLQVCDLYRDRWNERLADEQGKRGVDWEPDLSEHDAFAMGLDALAVTFAELVPQLGRPVAVQRKLEFRIAPPVDWTVQCFLDLETLRDPEDDTGEPVAEVVDYKVKSSLISQTKADVDPQAGLYLAGRWLEGRPAEAFRFAQIAKPGARRKRMSTALVTTTRSIGQQRASLARIAQAASQIQALYERFGPDEPWGFADPTSWKCSERYCAHWARCPGGAGL
jgi:PD-(D/E)XK nuclease superfamily